MNVKKNGFTLVELLVVIAIIALLLAILLPAISKAKSLAKTAVCKQHAKQVATAWMTFATETNNALSAHTTSGNQWIRNLYEYVDFEEKVFTCPVANKPVNETNWWSNGGKDTWGTASHAWTLIKAQYPDKEKDSNGVPEYRYWGAFAYNRWLTPVGSEKDNGFNSITSIEFPSSTPMFAESINRSGIVEEDDEIADDLEDPGGVLSGSATGGKGQLAKHSVNRHGDDNQGRLNIALVDSSVSTFEITQQELMLDLYWHKNWDVEKVTGSGGGGGGAGGGGGPIF